MKIKFTTAMTLYSGGSYQQGAIVDLNDGLAKNLVACKCATFEEKEEEVVKPKPKPKAKAKKEKVEKEGE